MCWAGSFCHAVLMSFHLSSVGCARCFCRITLFSVYACELPLSYRVVLHCHLPPASCILFRFHETEKMWKMITVFWMCVAFTCFVLRGIFVAKVVQVVDPCFWFIRCCRFHRCSQLEDWSKWVESSHNFRSCLWSQTATSASHSAKMIFRRIFLDLGWSRSNPSRVKVLWRGGARDRFFKWTHL